MRKRPSGAFHLLCRSGGLGECVRNINVVDRDVLNEEAVPIYVDINWKFTARCTARRIKGKHKAE
jgi:hypothetical protein